MVVEINIQYVLYINMLRGNSQLNCLPQCYRNLTSLYSYLINRTNGRRFQVYEVLNSFRGSSCIYLPLWCGSAIRPEHSGDLQVELTHSFLTTNQKYKIVTQSQPATSCSFNRSFDLRLVITGDSHIIMQKVPRHSALSGQIKANIK